MVSKYDNFKLSTSVDKPAKLCGEINRSYVGIICPHCKDTFAEILQSNIRSKKATKCKAHLAKCPSYECPSCDEDDTPAKSVSNALVVHGRCIAEREVLEQKKSSLEEKLDAMTQQLSASHEEAKREREEARQQQEGEREQARHSQDNLTNAINGVKSQLDRWEGGLVSTMECEFKLVRPITAETIPIQIRSRESQLALQYCKTHAATETDKERMTTEISAKDKEIVNLRAENERVRSQNAGLRTQLASLDSKYKDSLAEKMTMVERTHMNQKLIQGVAETKRKYSNLKMRSMAMHKTQAAEIQEMKEEIARLEGSKRRSVPMSEADARALAKRPKGGGPPTG